MREGLGQLPMVRQSLQCVGRRNLDRPATKTSGNAEICESSEVGSQVRAMDQEIGAHGPQQGCIILVRRKVCNGVE
jgi:hypothetical protein